MPENLGFPLFILAVLFFLGWFAVGTQWNVRKGNAVMRWMQQGLPLVGERTTMRWMGSSVVEMKLAKAKGPFRTVETLLIFEPRDVPFLWLLERLRGRRDLLIFRTQLRAAPEFEAEIFDPRGWTTHSTERDVKQKNWTRLTLPPTQPWLAYYTGAPGAQALQPLLKLAAETNGSLVRLSVHRDTPNLEIHWLMPDIKTGSALDLFTRFREMGESSLTA